MSKPNIRSRLVACIAVLAALFITGVARAQYQVSQPGEPGPNNPQGDPNGANSPNRQPGVEIYGNNNRDKPVRYPQQVEYLPSEILIAQQRSGATPSEIRTRADWLGPLAPNGNADYIPPMSALQRALGVRQPSPFGPQWQTSPGGVNRPMATGNNTELNPALANPALTAVRDPLREAGAPTQSIIQGPIIRPRLDAGERIDQKPLTNSQLGPVTSVNTTVYRPLRMVRPTTRPATQPATAPSLAPAAR